MDDFLDELSKQIISLQTDANINQRQLAELVGKSESAVSKWVNAERQPKLDSLRTLADKLGYHLRVRFIPREATQVVVALDAEVVDDAMGVQALGPRRRELLRQALHAIASADDDRLEQLDILVEALVKTGKTPQRARRQSAS